LFQVSPGDTQPPAKIQRFPGAAQEILRAVFAGLHFQHRYVTLKNFLAASPG
jgi:hypothetical protein